MPPHPAAVTRELQFADAAPMKVKVDLSVFFSGVTLKETHHIMSPSAEAVRLSHLFAECFSVLP